MPSFSQRSSSIPSFDPALIPVAVLTKCSTGVTVVLGPDVLKRLPLLAAYIMCSVGSLVSSSAVAPFVAGAAAGLEGHDAV